MADEVDTGGNASQDDAAVVAGAIDTSGGDAGAVADATGGTTDQAVWNYAEGIAGEGEAPEWFKGDKYNSVADQAKAYKDLEGRFGSFTGAPEEYEPVELREELKEMGIEIAADDPMMEEALKFAKETNMNQEGLNKMVNLYANVQAAEQKALQEYKAEELKALGSNAETRVNNLNAWANANLPPELMEGFQGMAQSAAAVQAMERLVAMTRAAPMNANAASPVSGPTAEDVHKMQFEKDEHGNRRLQTDPAFRRKFEEMANKVHGAEDHMITIG